MDPTDAKFRMPLLVAAAVIVLWSGLGVLDARNVPAARYQTAPGYVVTSVLEGSASQAAGLRVGDRVRAIDGVAIEDTRELLRQPRPEIGSTTVPGIERDGSAMTVDVENAAPSTRPLIDSYLIVLVGLCFVFFGYSAYVKAPDRKTLLLALAGVGIGLSFAGGPCIASPILSSLVSTVGVFLVYPGLAMLYQFILSMPRPSAALERARTVRPLYAPAVIAGLAIGVVIVDRLDATGTLNRAIQIVIGVVLAGYFPGSIVAMVRRYSKANDADQQAHGLGLMRAGTVIGFAPLIIAIVTGIVAPRVVLPARITTY